MRKNKSEYKSEKTKEDLPQKTKNQSEKYKIINNLTSDVMFEAYGRDLKEVFENAAEGLFSVVCKIDQVNPKEKEQFVFKAENPEELMLNWLQGLIAIIDIEHKFFSKFVVEDITDTKMKASCYGEPACQEKGCTVVKAVTHHNYKFEKTQDGYKVTVTLDI